MLDNQTKRILRCAVVLTILGGAAAILLRLCKCGAVSGRAAIIVSYTILAGIFIVFMIIALQRKIDLYMAVYYCRGGSIARRIIHLTGSVLLWWIVVISFFHSSDTYAECVKAAVSADMEGLEFLPFPWSEERLSLTVRIDAVDQLEQFIQNPTTELYSYPVSDDTRYKMLSKLCTRINDIINDLNTIDKDDHDLMQKAFDAIDAIGSMGYMRPLTTKTIELFVELILLLQVVRSFCNLVQCIHVRRYVKENGGLDKVIADRQNQKFNEEGENEKNE